MRRIAITAAAVLGSLVFAGAAMAELRGTTTTTPGSGTQVLSTQADPATILHYSPTGLCYDAWTGGSNLRNSTTVPMGKISVPALVAVNKAFARLYWVVLADTPPSPTGVFNGTTITGTLCGPVTGSPCWPQLSAYPFICDVTALVVPGVNTLDGFPDSGVAGAGDNTEGATLVVVHSTSGVDKEIFITCGNDLLAGTGFASLPFGPTGSPAGTGAELTFIVGDGQPAPDAAYWNGVSLAGTDAFQGLDQGTGIGYWDTLEFGVTLGANVAEVESPVGFADCLNWVGTVLKIKSGGCEAVGVQDKTWGGVKSIYKH